MDPLFKKIDKQINDISDSYLGVLGLYALSLEGKGHHLSVNPNETFPTASIIKVPMLMEYYKKVEEDLLDPGEEVTLPADYICGGSGVLQHLTPGVSKLTLEDYATLMIVLSDNVATNMLYDKVGSDDINDLLGSLGLEDTKLARKMQAYRDIKSENENITTPENMTRLLKVLYKSEGVSNDVSSKTIAKLKLYKDGIIRGGVPDGIDVADKMGWMGGVLCNTGIVHHQSNPYAVTIMFKHVPRSDQKMIDTRSTARRIIKLVHQYYDEMGSSSKYGIRFS